MIMKKTLLKISFIFVLITNSNLVVAQCWQSISFGNGTVAAIKQDGALYTWGANDIGQMGIGTITAGMSTETQIGNSNNWQSVSAGHYYMLAIKTDGTLWAWGANFNGQLGDGTKINKSSPIQIGTDTNWQIVYSGDRNASAIKTNGTLWAWGDNTDGQFGDGTTTEKLIPTQIGIETNWMSISIGDNTVLALKTNGTLWAWGSNSSGQLGNGNFWGAYYTPAQIGTDTNWQKIFSTWASSYAIKTNGTLWSWGSNQSGILGNGNTTNLNIPAQMGADNNWAHVDGHYTHITAIKTTGTLWSWGTNDYGQLGNGTTTTTPTYTPTQLGTSTNWQTTSGDIWSNQALKTDGTRWAWGYNSSGQIGDGSSSNKNSPVTASCPINVITGFNNTPNKQNSITIYPNPTSSTLNIEVKQQTLITIVNVLGEVVKTETINGLSTIDVSALNAGIYFIQDLKLGKAVKFIKE